MKTKIKKLSFSAKHKIWLRKAIDELNRNNKLLPEKRLKELTKKYFVVDQALSAWIDSDGFDRNANYRVDWVCMAINLEWMAANLLEAERCLNAGEECSVDLGFFEFHIQSDENSLKEAGIIQK